MNRRGELVGINTAIISRTGGYQVSGLRFQQTAQSIAEAGQDGAHDRGWLGIGIQKLSPELAAQLGVPTGTKGTLVSG